MSVAISDDTSANIINPRNKSTAVGRWSGLGPYYAMFPVEFAFAIIREHSKPGDWVLDPFAGRATSIYAATVLGRSGCGVEINPLGWLYGRVKLEPAPLQDVLDSLVRIGEAASSVRDRTLRSLPPFFRVCYTGRVLRFLIAAREELRWKADAADATLMAIIMVYLHGAKEKSLSNQMRQGKSVSPNYALNWWKKQASSPPKRDPVEFLSTRVKWRYAKGIPDQSNGKMVLGNSISELRNLYQGVEAGEQVRFNLLFTSPPYCGITDYYYDQWLRLWMLGGPPQAVHYNLKYQDDFYSKADYSDMLQDVFRACAKLLTKEATIYVRTDAREYTFKTTLCALKEAFPNKRVVTLPRPFTKSTQTALFGDKSDKPGEMDIIMRS